MPREPGEGLFEKLRDRDAVVRRQEALTLLGATGGDDPGIPPASEE